MNKFFNFQGVKLNIKILSIAFVLTSIGYAILLLYWNTTISYELSHKFNYNLLSKGYNHNVIWDFFNKDSVRFSFINIYLILFFILGILMYIFFNTGLLYLSNVKHKISWDQYYTKSKQFFLRNLAVGLIYIFLCLVYIGINLYVILSFVFVRLETASSEKPIILLGILLLMVVLLGLMYLITASILSRKIILGSTTSFLNSLKTGLRLAFKNIFPYYVPWIIFLILTFVLSFVYLELVNIFESIFYKILIQVIFLFTIFILKFNLYSNIQLSSENKLSKELR